MQAAARTIFQELESLKPRSLSSHLRSEVGRKLAEGTARKNYIWLNEQRVLLAHEAIDIYERYPQDPLRWDAVAIAYDQLIQYSITRSNYWRRIARDQNSEPRRPRDSDAEWKSLLAAEDDEGRRNSARYFWVKYYSDDFFFSDFKKKVFSLGNLALTQDELSPGALASLAKNRISEILYAGEPSLAFINEIEGGPGTAKYQIRKAVKEGIYREVRQLFGRIEAISQLDGEDPRVTERSNGLVEFLDSTTGDYLVMVKSVEPDAYLSEIQRLLSSNHGWAKTTAQYYQRDALKAAGGSMKGAPLNFSFTAIDGRQVDSETMRGKVVLIDFWATWCQPCIDEVPNLKAVYAKYNDLGFEIVGISLDSAEDRQRLVDLCNKQGISWPQHFDGRGWENEFAVKFGISGLPSMMLLDKEGRLVSSRARGSALEREVRKQLGLPPLEPNAVSEK